MYFESMHVSNTKECEEDYVQFGRDILFITSYRSKKFCGMIDGSFSVRNITTNREHPSPVTPISKRIYSESSDQEMDIWIKMNVPSVGSSQKNLTLVVTPFKRSCSSSDPSYQTCGKGGQCVRREFFCDGSVNCAFPEDSKTGRIGNALFYNK